MEKHSIRLRMLLIQVARSNIKNSFHPIFAMLLRVHSNGSRVLSNFQTWIRIIQRFSECAKKLQNYRGSPFELTC